MANQALATNSSLLSVYSEKLADLLAQNSGTDFPKKLVELLNALVPIDDATIIFYPPEGLPIIEYFQPHRDGSSQLDLFVGGAFLLDPFYRASAMHKQFGFFRLKDLAPQGFRQSEYYNSFYVKSNYKDECGFLVDTANSGFVNISLARMGRPQAFSKNQAALLRSVEPVINFLVARHWRNERSRKTSKTNLRRQLHAALESFGKSVLTERELQVVNYFLHGYSTRHIADKLCISIETVKLHRKNAYAKLSVKSQGELFYLFLDSVMSAKNYDGGDTLEQYLQKSR